LLEYKVRYLHVQKILYVVLIISHKQRHYFDEHKILVVELGGHHINFTPHKAIKYQALADFVAEWIEIQLHQ
jgi:hypothetical protein